MRPLRAIPGVIFVLLMLAGATAASAHCCNPCVTMGPYACNIFCCNCEGPCSTSGWDCNKWPLESVGCKKPKSGYKADPGVKITKVSKESASARYSSIDANHDGGISLDEAMTWVKKSGSDLSEEKIKEGFKAMDKNGDGKIDKGEFDPSLQKRRRRIRD